MSLDAEASPQIPNKLINFAGIRVHCLRAAYLNPLQQWSAEEMTQVQSLLAKATQDYYAAIWDGHTWDGVKDRTRVDWDLNKGFRALAHDFGRDEFRPSTPKWMALYSWLAQESPVVLNCPALLKSILKVAFSRPTPMLPEEEYDLQ